ncbi:hypothetical protein DI000_15540, partial [Legionella pneumophila]
STIAERPKASRAARLGRDSPLYGAHVRRLCEQGAEVHNLSGDGDRRLVASERDSAGQPGERRQIGEPVIEEHPGAGPAELERTVVIHRRECRPGNIQHDRSIGAAQPNYRVPGEELHDRQAFGEGHKRELLIDGFDQDVESAPRRRDRTRGEGFPVG